MFLTIGRKQNVKDEYFELLEASVRNLEIFFFNGMIKIFMWSHTRSNLIIFDGYENFENFLENCSALCESVLQNKKIFLLFKYARLSH